MASRSTLDDILELAGLLTPAWAELSAGISDWHPRCEGDGGSGGSGDGGSGDGGDGGSGDAGDGGSGDGGDGGDDDDKNVDWKQMARRHERRSKQSASRVTALEAKIAELEKGQQTDSEKAIAEAKKQARDEALAEGEKERRADRLEIAATRLAAAGLKVGDDPKVRFADPEDALVNIERAIRAGDVDEDELFDDKGKVQTKALTEALAELLTRKPHLRAGRNGAAGSADAGRGSGDDGGADMNSLIRRRARS